MLHSPRAWLGTAFHLLMAARPFDTEEAARVWERNSWVAGGIIGSPAGQAVRQPGALAGYYLVRQRAIASAVQGAPPVGISEAPGSGRSASAWNRAAFDGTRRTVGRPARSVRPPIRDRVQVGAA